MKQVVIIGGTGHITGRVMEAVNATVISVGKITEQNDYDDMENTISDSDYTIVNDFTSIIRIIEEITDTCQDQLNDIRSMVINNHIDLEYCAVKEKDLYEIPLRQNLGFHSNQCDKVSPKERRCRSPTLLDYSY